MLLMQQQGTASSGLGDVLVSDTAWAVGIKGCQHDINTCFLVVLGRALSAFGRF